MFRTPFRTAAIPASIAEHEAAGETEGAYHDIRQVLRVNGVGLTFRAWATFERSFPLLWHAVRANAGTVAFERAADELRAEAVRGAMELPPVTATSEVALGPSQLYQIGAALARYHYVNPKLLILTSAVRLALEDADAIPGSPSADFRKLPRGVPARMYPMEMVDEGLDESQVRLTFEDIRKTFPAKEIDDEYRTLALWPGYLEAAWQDLRLVVGTPRYNALAASIQRHADALARALPYRVKLSRLDIASIGENDDDFFAAAQRFEALLPARIINVALLTLEGTSAEVCMESPFPIDDEERT